jgi:hypothetical protein
MTMPHYAEAFYPAEGRCFRFVSVTGAHGQPAHCPAPPAWRGRFVAGDRRQYRVEACGALLHCAGPGRVKARSLPGFRSP